ncbi:hypothetical protein BJH93_07600 [Kocuria polaris]|nr:hypothetical protein [Kocuria polaris]
MFLVSTSLFAHGVVPDIGGQPGGPLYWLMLAMFAVSLLVGAVAFGRWLGRHRTSSVAPLVMAISAWVAVLMVISSGLLWVAEASWAGDLMLAAYLVGVVSFLSGVVALVLTLTTRRI